MLLQYLLFVWYFSIDDVAMRHNLEYYLMGTVGYSMLLLLGMRAKQYGQGNMATIISALALGRRGLYLFPRLPDIDFSGVQISSIRLLLFVRLLRLNPSVVGKALSD